MKKTCCILLAFVCSFAAFAQKKPAAKVGIPTFQTTVHNFGSIKEANGKVSHVFRYTNTGTAPLRINDVFASCGCTSPEFSTEAIAPNASGLITVVFDPTNRVGKINKTITVFFNGNPGQVVLYLTGEVLPVNSGIYELFPKVQGNMRFTNTTIDFKKVIEGEIDTQYVGLYNTTGRKVIIRNVVSGKGVQAPKRLYYIQPDGGDNVLFTFSNSAFQTIGPVVDTLKLLTDDDSIPTKTIIIKADIVQNFDTLTPAERLQTAKYVMLTDTVQLGELYVNESVYFSIPIQNKGKTPLRIRRIMNNCNCIELADTVLPTVAKGKKGAIKLKMKASEFRGSASHVLYVYTNDPDRPYISIPIVYNVVLPGYDKLK